MKLHRFLLASVAVAAVLASSSCKKDDSNVIKRSQLDGQWACTYLLKDYGPSGEYPYVLLDVDAAAGKASLYQFCYSDRIGSFELRGNKVFFKHGSTTVEYEISYFDHKSVIFSYTIDGSRYDACFVSMNRILPGAWKLTLFIDDTSTTRYFRFDDGGTGAELNSDGSEKGPINWEIMPASSYQFKFVLAVPGSEEKTFSIYAVYSENNLDGFDEDNNPITLTRSN